MKIKNFLMKCSATLIVAMILLFGAVSVSAAAQVQTTPDTAYSVETMAYDYYDDYDRNPPVNWFKIIGISFLISTVGTIAAVVMIYRGYKFNGRTEPYPYNNKAPLELTDSEDILVDTDVRRERIERDRR